MKQKEKKFRLLEILKGHLEPSADNQCQKRVKKSSYVLNKATFHPCSFLFSLRGQDCWRKRLPFSSEDATDSSASTRPPSTLLCRHTGLTVRSLLHVRHSLDSWEALDILSSLMILLHLASRAPFSPGFQPTSLLALVQPPWLVATLLFDSSYWNDSVLSPCLSPVFSLSLGNLIQSHAP